MAPQDVFQGRRSALQKYMVQEQIDYLLFSVSTDMAYVSGYDTWPSERLTLFVLPKNGTPTMILPEFEAGPLRESQPSFNVTTWTEDQNPFKLIDALITTSTSAPLTIQVNNTMPSRFYLPIASRLANTNWGLASEALSRLRMVKDAAEVELLRHAQSQAMECLRTLLTTQFSGRREIDIGRELWALCLDSDLKVSNFAIVGSGPNGAHPHYHLGERMLSEGDAIVIDFGGVYKGYRADLTRTVHVGAPSKDFLAAYELVKNAQEEAFGAIRPGVPCEFIDSVARDVITRGGYGPNFIHRLGHGIGMDEHEEPYIVTGNDTALRPGMTFTLEPGIYLEGRFGIRIEDQVVVTNTGAERLGDLTRELVVVR